MTGYTKLFASILASTIWQEDDATRIVWITLLVMADQHGEVHASIPGVAKFAQVSLPATEAALEKLKSPDPYSRTKDFEGRRIAEIDGGWVILNHAKYRAKASAEELRERARIRKQRQREREATEEKSTVTQGHAPVTPCRARVDQQPLHRETRSLPPDVTPDVTLGHAMSRLVTESHACHDKQKQKQKQKRGATHPEHREPGRDGEAVSPPFVEGKQGAVSCPTLSKADQITFDRELSRIGKELDRLGSPGDYPREHPTRKRIEELRARQIELRRILGVKA